MFTKRFYPGTALTVHRESRYTICSGSLDKINLNTCKTVHSNSSRSYSFCSVENIKFSTLRLDVSCRGVLLTWIQEGQGPTALAVGAGGGCLDIFCSRLSFLFSFSLSLGDGPI